METEGESGSGAVDAGKEAVRTACLYCDPYGHSILFAEEHLAVAQNQASAYEGKYMKAMESILRPGMTCVDVGAHVGCYTLVMAKLVGPAGHVYAFEPNPLVVDLLRQNCTSHGYTNVTIHQVACGSQRAASALWIHPESGRSSTRHELVPVPVGIAIVEVRRLDDTVAGSVDFVKIDAEGDEGDILRGMGDIFAANPKVSVMLELNGELLKTVGVDALTVLDPLIVQGFIIHVVGETGGLLPVAPEHAIAMCATGGNVIARRATTG